MLFAAPGALAVPGRLWEIPYEVGTQAQADTSFFPLETYSGRQRARTKLPGVSRACAALIIGAAGLVLLGWITGASALIRLIPSAVAMKPMTALVMIAAGLSLWRVSVERKERPFDPFGAGLATLVLLVGAVKLADYIGPFRIPVDDLLFAGKLAHPGAYAPGEMAPNTALGFVFCGVALLLIDTLTRNAICAGQIAILSLGCVSFLALVGYGYGTLLFYQVGNALPMSLESAVCFALLCAGYLLARPEQGVMTVLTSRTTGGTVARRLLPVAILMPVALGALLLMGERAGYYHWEFAVSILAVATVVIFSALTWWNARLLYAADRERARTEQRVAAQHLATRVLAEASGPAEAIPEILRLLGETLGWNLGLFWTPAEGGGLRCASSWHRSRSRSADWINGGPESTLASGEDLPGQVWSSGSPVCLSDVSSDRHFKRAALAAGAGLRSACAFPVFADHQPYGVLEFYSDGLNNADSDLREMLSTVSTQIGLFIERTRAEEQLRQTTANLQRSNTELQQFASIASHDLFEPLRMVTSYLQLLSHRYRTQLDAQANQFIELAAEGAKRMHALIHDLLEYSRVESRGRALQATEAQQTLAAALANLKVAIEESGAKVIASPLPRVNADSVQLTQLFQNLIGNAIKFRGAAAPVVEVGAERHEREWWFYVRDNGIGIDPRYFERVFLVFQRLHTRQEYPGTGMGLAICKKIVERHRGRIWVESKPGEGAVFWFSLPLAQ